MDLIDLLRAGEDKVREHDRASELADSAHAFLACVSEWRNFTVEAASPAAERVLGAAMMIEPRLRAGRSKRTVILDVNIASGTLVSNAARRVREVVDPEWLLAVVINSLTTVDLRWSIEGVDSLLVCDGVSARQHGEPSKHSVGVHLP